MAEQYKYDNTKFVPANVSVSLTPSGRYPVLANMQWNKLSDIQKYVDDKSTSATAIPGLLLTVVNDGENNGVYFVKSVANDQQENGEVVKLSFSTQLEYDERVIASALTDLHKKYLLLSEQYKELQNQYSNLLKSIDSINERLESNVI